MNSLSIFSCTLLICVASCEPSFEVTEQAITGLETPHARPRATFEDTNTYGVFCITCLIVLVWHMDAWWDALRVKIRVRVPLAKWSPNTLVRGRCTPCLRTKAEGARGWQGGPYRRLKLRTRTCLGWGFWCLNQGDLAGNIDKYGPFCTRTRSNTVKKIIDIKIYGWICTKPYRWYRNAWKQQWG